MEKTFSEDNERVMSVIEVWNKEEKETVSYIRYVMGLKVYKQ